jgi:hypothetical protein
MWYSWCQALLYHLIKRYSDCCDGTFSFGLDVRNIIWVPSGNTYPIIIQYTWDLNEVPFAGPTYKFLVTMLEILVGV